MNIYPISTTYLGGDWSQILLFELVDVVFVFIQ